MNIYVLKTLECNFKCLLNYCRYSEKKNQNHVLYCRVKCSVITDHDEMITLHTVINRILIYARL